MKKQILQFTFLSFVLAIIYFTNVSYSSGPPTTAVTGGCTCHGAANSSTVVAVSFNGGNLYYNNGQTYPITISVVSYSAKPAAGFALSTNVGTLGTAPSGTQKVGNVWMHSSPKATSGVSPTFASWTINWTAPSTGAAPLQIFAAGNAVNLATGSSGDQWAFASSLNIALPVNFVNFSATTFENNNVINWSVSNEENLKEYQIEHSLNGKDFTVIGTVEARNYSKYEFIDNKQINTSNIYYRIKALDVDGKSIITEVKSILLKNNSVGVKIYPSIIGDNNSINIQHNETDARILIYGTNGQLVNIYELNSGINQIQLNGFAKGVYFVFLKSNNKTSFIDKILLQ